MLQLDKDKGIRAHQELLLPYKCVGPRVLAMQKARSLSWPGRCRAFVDVLPWLSACVVCRGGGGGEVRARERETG